MGSVDANINLVIYMVILKYEIVVGTNSLERMLCAVTLWSLPEHLILSLNMHSSVKLNNLTLQLTVVGVIIFYFVVFFKIFFSKPRLDQWMYLWQLREKYDIGTILITAKRRWWHHVYIRQSDNIRWQATLLFSLMFTKIPLFKATDF